MNYEALIKSDFPHNIECPVSEVVFVADENTKSVARCDLHAVPPPVLMPSRCVPVPMPCLSVSGYTVPPVPCSCH